MLWTYGVPWITADGKSTNFNSPDSVAALKLLRGLVDDGVIVIAATAEQDFANGRGAFVLASSGNVTSFFDTIGSNFKWGVTLPPQKAGVQPVTELFGAVTAGFKSNPQAQLATWQFMRYFASAPTQGAFVGASAYFPPQKSAANTEVLKALYVKIPQYKQAFDQVAPSMRLLPQHTALGNIRNTISNDVVNEVLLKRLTPEEGAQKLTALANDALK
jgi:ABC-type glycerol-3-phosphate transport system substrate-binding protein